MGSTISRQFKSALLRLLAEKEEANSKERVQSSYYYFDVFADIKKGKGVQFYIKTLSNKNKRKLIKLQIKSIAEISSYRL